MKNCRKNSIAFGGGAYGDEGKGRLVDKFVCDYAKKGPVIVYRDNGGANARHTVEFETGERVALHQLPSGVFIKGATVVLGKGMVLHPGDLTEEIHMVQKAGRGKLFSKILIDEMAVLSLDTHRAFESVLKEWQEGSRGSTGRGISPAYADILLRHPLRMRDLFAFDQEKFRKHFRLYKAFVKGLGKELEEVGVAALGKDVKQCVGSEDAFIKCLKKQRKELVDHIQNVYAFVDKTWHNDKYGYVFEKGQGVGLSPDWGVYPDVTASDTTFEGIFASTEGIVEPETIAYRASVIKATYMSSVGARVLPTKMDEELASKIREDAKEYGATTKRPRGIAYIDIPTLKYFAKVGRANCLVLTHMDIVYPKTPIKVCVRYEINGKNAPYRPDQMYLNSVKPKYIELKTWDREDVSKAKRGGDLPKNAKSYLDFISEQVGVLILAITTGPKREQGIMLKSL